MRPDVTDAETSGLGKVYHVSRVTENDFRTQTDGTLLTREEEVGATSAGRHWEPLTDCRNYHAVDRKGTVASELLQAGNFLDKENGVLIPPAWLRGPRGREPSGRCPWEGSASPGRGAKTPPVPAARAGVAGGGGDGGCSLGGGRRERRVNLVSWQG